MLCYADRIELFVYVLKKFYYPFMLISCWYISKVYFVTYTIVLDQEQKKEKRIRLSRFDDLGDGYTYMYV